MNQPIHREQWEYKRVDSSYLLSEYDFTREGGPLDEYTLNELGKDGWELVSVATAPSDGDESIEVAVFKRRLIKL